MVVASSAQVLLVSSHTHTTTNGSALLWSVIIDVFNTTFSLTNGIAGATISIFDLHLIITSTPIMVRILQSAIELLDSGLRIIDASGFDTIVAHSQFFFSELRVRHQWLQVVTVAPLGTTVSPMFSLFAFMNVSNTNFSFIDCNFTIDILSTPVSSPPAVLLTVSGEAASLSVTITDTSIILYACNLANTSVQRAAVLSIAQSQSVSLTTTNSIFANLYAVFASQQQSTRQPFTGSTASIGCDNTWCVPMDGTHCAPLSPAVFSGAAVVETPLCPINQLVGLFRPPGMPAVDCTATHSATNQLTLTPSTSVSIVVMPRTFTDTHSTASLVPSGTQHTFTNSHAQTPSMPVSSTSILSHSLTLRESSSLSTTVTEETEPKTTLSNSSPYSMSLSPAISLTTTRELLVSDGAPPFDAPVAVQAVTVAVVAPIAGAVLATTVPGLLQRTTVALRFSQCSSSTEQDTPPRGQSMAVMENPTRLAFGVAAGAMYRGSAVGNVIRKRMISTSHGETIGSSLAELRLPSRAFVVPATLLQPTVTAAVGLCLLNMNVGDIVLAVVSLVFFTTLVAGAAWVVRRGCTRLVTAVYEPPTAPGFLNYMSARHVAWVPRRVSDSSLVEGKQKQRDDNRWIHESTTRLLDAKNFCFSV